jgi:hypothetical protein
MVQGLPSNGLPLTKELPLTMDIRPEIQDLMRVSERLIGFAHQEGELTHDECNAIMFYAKELTREIAPFCPDHCETSTTE